MKWAYVDDFYLISFFMRWSTGLIIDKYFFASSARTRKGNFM